MKWNVRIDNKIVAVLNQGAYAVVCAKPGPHAVTIGDSTVIFAGGLIGAAANGASQSAETEAAKNGTFVAEPNGVYFIRSKGFGVDMLPREEAMKDIVAMKYDMGMES